MTFLWRTYSDVLIVTSILWRPHCDGLIVTSLLWWIVPFFIQNFYLKYVMHESDRTLKGHIVMRNALNLNSTRPPLTWSPSHIERGEMMLFLWKPHTGTVGFEHGTHAWLTRQSGALAIAPFPFICYIVVILEGYFVYIWVQNEECKV